MVKRLAWSNIRTRNMLHSRTFPNLSFIQKKNKKHKTFIFTKFVYICFPAYYFCFTLAADLRNSLFNVPLSTFAVVNASHEAWMTAKN